MHNLIFCCLYIVAASKDVRHRVSRADSNFKKNPKKVLRYDYILVMANHFSGCRLKGQLSFDDPDPRTPGTPEFP